jgi:endonuclease/exonuclease/phosphatase family metal-dependent hydrolase
MMSHRPISFLRDAYRQAVLHEKNETVAQLLTSGTAFDGGDMRPQVDPLPRFCERMRLEGTAICHYMPKLYGECANSSQCRADVLLDHTTNEKNVLSHYWLKRWKPIDGVYVTAQNSSNFFAVIKQEKPFTFCVNDDWPIQDSGYRAAIKPYRSYMAQAFPTTAPWETVGLRVMSFNIRKDTTRTDGTDGVDGSDAWPHRRELLLEDITSLKPDLLGMQEVLPHMAVWLREQIEPAGYTFVGQGRLGSDEDVHEGSNEMMAVFFRKSRFSLLESGHFWLSDTPQVPGSKGPEFKCSRMATWVRLRDSVSTMPGDGTLLFINTQLDHGADSTQTFGATVIKKFLEEGRASRGEPVILTGDMNSYDDSLAHSTLLSGTGMAQLKDTYRVVHPLSDEMESTSHPGWFRNEARLGPHPTPPYGRRIDYILVSTAAFDVAEATIDRFEDKAAATSEGSGLGEADGSGRFGRGRFPSDHFGVRATLEYRGSPGPHLVARDARLVDEDIAHEQLV